MSPRYDKLTKNKTIHSMRTLALHSLLIKLWEPINYKKVFHVYPMDMWYILSCNNRTLYSTYFTIQQS